MRARRLHCPLFSSLVFCLPFFLLLCVEQAFASVRARAIVSYLHVLVSLSYYASHISTGVKTLAHNILVPRLSSACTIVLAHQQKWEERFSYIPVHRTNIQHKITGNNNNQPDVSRSPKVGREGEAFPHIRHKWDG